MDEMSRKRYTINRKRQNEILIKTILKIQIMCKQQRQRWKRYGGAGNKKIAGGIAAGNEDCEWEVQLWAVWIWDL